MNSTTDSLFDRLGIYSLDCLPTNPKIRWNSIDPVWTIKVESGIYDNNYDSEHDFDLDYFGMTEEEACQTLTDEEFEKLITDLGF